MSMNVWKKIDERYVARYAMQGGKFGNFFLDLYRGDILRYFMLPAITDVRFEAVPMLKEMVGSLLDYGFVDHILSFALFLRRSDETGEALRRFYDILGEQTLFGKLLTKWCDEYNEYALWEHCKEADCDSIDNFDLHISVTAPPFICRKMLGLPDEVSVDDAIGLVGMRLRESEKRYGVIGEIGWLRHAYKQHNTDPAFVGELLKRVLIQFVDAADAKKQVYLAALLQEYVSFAQTAHTNSAEVNSGLYNVAGLGKAIGIFATDDGGERKKLLHGLEPSLWRNIVYFAICQCAHEKDYTTAAALLVRYFNDARFAKQAQMRQALYDTYMKVEDEVMALSLFCLIQWELRRFDTGFVGRSFTEAQKAAISTRFNELVRRFVKNTQDEIASIKGRFERERLARQNELECAQNRLELDRLARQNELECAQNQLELDRLARQNELERARNRREIALVEEQALQAALQLLQERSDRFEMVTSLLPNAAFFETTLVESMKQFCVLYGLPEGTDLLARLGDKERAVVVNYLRQGELIFTLLKTLQETRGHEEMFGNLDFSPAVLELTKALEYIANLIHKRIDVSVLRHNSSWVVVRGGRFEHVESIALGAFKHLFRTSSGGGSALMRRDDTDSTKTYLDDVLDVRRYCVPGTADGLAEEEICTQIFRDVDKLLKLRNSTAHKDTMRSSKYVLCRDLMITDYTACRFYLWRILSMIKDDVTLTDGSGDADTSSENGN